MKVRASRLLRDGLIIALITGVLAEITARVFTGHALGNFMPAISKYALVPYRPDFEKLKQWYAESSKWTYLVSDPQLGWTTAKNGHSEDGYQSNSQGARAPKDFVYSPEVPANKVRMVAVGDSFTHSYGVDLPGTWEVILEELRPDLEVVNLGIPGGGSDQALLRYMIDGPTFHADIAILGILPENMQRNLTITRYYFDPSGMFLFKPRFVLKNGALELIGSPTPPAEEQAKILSSPENYRELLANDQSYVRKDVEDSFLYNFRVYQLVATYFSYMRRKTDREDLIYGRNPEGVAVTAAIAARFDAEAEKAGAIPVVVIMPLRQLIEDQKFDSKTSPLVVALEKAGATVLDPSNAMRKAYAERGPDFLFQSGGRLHLSADGNRVMAQDLVVQLAPHIEKVLARKKAAVQAEASPPPP